MSNAAAVLVLFMVAAAATASAQIALSPLDGPTIRAELFGQRMTGEYPTGRQWAEQFNRDGTSLYVEDGVPVKGIMTLNGATLCFSYPETEQNGGCFEVWKRGDNCFDFYGSGEPVSLDSRRFGREWSARGWRMDKPATCMSEQIS